MSDIDEALVGLAAKINGLDLTEAEEAVLVGLITGNGEENEVEGFGLGASSTQFRNINIGIGELSPLKSWSISGDADDRPTEEVAFYYNKIAFGYAR